MSAAMIISSEVAYNSPGNETAFRSMSGLTLDVSAATVAHLRRYHTNRIAFAFLKSIIDPFLHLLGLPFLVDIPPPLVTLIPALFLLVGLILVPRLRS